VRQLERKSLQVIRAFVMQDLRDFHYLHGVTDRVTEGAGSYRLSGPGPAGPPAPDPHHHLRQLARIHWRS